ncbi:hypothetical protein C483_11251 [Natrialba hulunbeirensis JCM 10989]|uniref:Uncharacterized protein n=1 Tax=Natrialba hulunbeirensis JCM 10989 TaxID=1227493 RepID=L9ZZS2_9EURY|nr:hypothetical protein C483_11251 [Natrialba hulunbeirensis JCM 10989]
MMAPRDSRHTRSYPVAGSLCFQQAVDLSGSIVCSFNDSPLVSGNRIENRFTLRLFLTAKHRFVIRVTKFRQARYLVIKINRGYSVLCEKVQSSP